MSRLFKLLLLILLFNTSSFAKYYHFYFYTDTSNIPKKYDYSGDPNSYIRIGNDIYKSRLGDIEYLHSNSDFDKSSLYRFGHDNGRPFIFENTSPLKLGCTNLVLHDVFELKSDCSEEMYNQDPDKDVTLHPFRFLSLDKIVTCQPDEHFNTQTKQCQKCPEGQKWDQKRNMCWKDCTNIDKNMYGFFDYTVSGKCYDCSNSKTVSEIYKCLCDGRGYGVPNELTDVGDINGDGCRFYGTCSNGYGFPYTDPECKKPKDPKPDDNNSTKPKPNDNNSTKPNDSGNSGNSGGGNSGNSGGGNDSQENNNDDDSGGGGPGGSEFCKKNPNHKSCKLGKPGGDGNTTIINNGGGGGGGNGNGDDEKAVFNEGDFKYGDVEKKYEELKAKFEDADKTYLDEYKKFESGIKQFIENVKGNGLSRFDKGSTLNNCPKSYSIPIINKTEKIEFDICEIFKPMRNTFYYVAYASFFLSFLILTIKLMIFSF